MFNVAVRVPGPVGENDRSSSQRFENGGRHPGETLKSDAFGPVIDRLAMENRDEVSFVIVIDR